MVDYATALQVTQRLNLTDQTGVQYTALTIDNIVVPPKAVIEEMIEEAELDIEKECGRAWRTITVSDWEYHDFSFRDYRRSRGTHGIRGRRERKIRLNFDFVSAITAFEILTGAGTWTDLVATGTLGVSPYDPDGDYFFQGRDLYMLSTTPMYGRDNVRVKYTYGETVVPKDIRKACILIAASRIIDYYPDMFIRAEGQEGGISYGSLQSMWRKEIDRILARYNSESFKPIYI